MSEQENVTPPHKMTKDQLKVLALKQRIGEITSRYEDELADFRANATQQLGAFDDLVKNQEQQIEALQQQLKSYQDRDENQKKANDSSE